jgi:large-conductance mechanosensitive channel
MAAKRLAAVITYGNLVQAINFVIIAFFILWCYELLAQKKEVVVVASDPRKEELLTQIRDLLKVTLHIYSNLS